MGMLVDLCWAQLSDSNWRCKSDCAWRLTLGWAPVYSPCVLPRAQAEGTAVAQRSSSMVLAEAQEDKPNWANTFQASPCVVPASILLAKAGHHAEPKVKEQGSTSHTRWGQKAHCVSRTNISGLGIYIFFSWRWRRKGGNTFEKNRMYPHPKCLLRYSVFCHSSEICSEPTWQVLPSILSRNPLV